MNENILIAIISALGLVIAAVAGNWVLSRRSRHDGPELDDEQTKKLLRRFLKDRRFKQRRLSTLREKTKIYDHDKLRSLLRSIGAHAVQDRSGEECWTLHHKK
jgi:hypothetical protein